MKKFLTFFCLLFCIGMVVVGCGKKDPDNTPGGSQTVPETVEDPADITVSVIYPLDAGKMVMDEAKALGDFLTKKTGYTVTVRDDYLKSGEATAPEAYEIYLGNVSRNESKDFLNSLLPYGYGWAVNGNKLVLGAISDMDCQMLCRKFRETCENSLGSYASPFSLIEPYSQKPEIFDFSSGATIAVNFAKEDLKTIASDLKDRLSVMVDFKIELVDGKNGDIVIGTGYEEVGYNECLIQVSEECLYLSAHQASDVKSAVDAFLRSVRQYNDFSGKKTPAISKELSYRAPINRDFPSLPMYQNNSSAVASKFSYIVSVPNTDTAKFEKYVDKLEDAGYRSVERHEKSGNIYCTYINDTYMIYTYYVNYNKTVKITASPISQYHAMNAMHKGTGSGKIEFSQLDIGNCNNAEGKFNANGMSYAFKMSDGSFILLDGGNLTIDSEIDRLYQWLDDNSDGEIIIAAWLFSHLHGDHIGVYCGFMNKYGDKVKVESLVTNYPTFDYWKSVSDIVYASRPDEAEMTGWHKTCYQNFEAVMTKYFGGTKLVIPHTGQTLSVGDAKIEIMYTHEDMFPATFERYNDNSVIYRITIAGKSFLMGGDAELQATEICANMHKGDLKSDYVQMEHHGYGKGAVIEYYLYADADTLLIPCAESSYPNHTKLFLAQYRAKGKNFKRIIMANNGIWTTSLT